MPDPSASLLGQSEQGPDVLERAWRNGWGSALNFLRAADAMVSEAPLPGAEDDASRAIIVDLVARWVEIVDSVTEGAVGKARDVGFAAVPPREASDA